MKDITNKGQVMSIIIYALYGITAIVGIVFTKTSGTSSYAIAAMFFWSATLITMVAIRLSDLRHSTAYKALYIMSVCLFAVLLQMLFRSIYLVFFIYAVLWLTLITFLDKKCFHFAIIMQSISLLLLVLLPDKFSGLTDFNLTSWFFSSFGFLAADWIGVIIINVLLQLDEETEEHDRSMDDLLDILEAKHNEASQATTARSHLLSMMSNELRIPLNDIITRVESILDNTTDEEIANNAKEVLSSGKEMLELVNSILDISRTTPDDLPLGINQEEKEND